MKLNDRQEEILETLWTESEEEKQKMVAAGLAKGEQEIGELEKAGYIKIVNDKIALTEKGKGEGGKIVRRHRLAERLFSDVLDVKKKLVHPLSCQFEHLLHEGIEDNICTLLGHPATCPHGQAIPRGECCKKSKREIAKVVSSLDTLQVNQKGRIAYIQTKDSKKLQKLMAMAVLPGAAITIIQKFPSYVFQIGQSQFAVDKDIASAIYVRIAK